MSVTDAAAELDPHPGAVRAGHRRPRAEADQRARRRHRAGACRRLDRRASSAAPARRPRCASTACMTLSTNEPLLLRIVPGEVAGPSRGGRGHRGQPVPVRAARWRSSSSRGCRRRGCSWSGDSPDRRGARRARPAARVRRRAGGRGAGRSRRPATPRSSSPRTGAARSRRSTAALRLGVPYVGLIASRIRGRGGAGRPGRARRAAQPGAQPGRAGHRRPDGGGDRAVGARRAGRRAAGGRAARARRRCRRPRSTRSAG